PMAEYLPQPARGADLSLALARTLRLLQRRRCAGLPARSQERILLMRVVHCATPAKNVVRLTRRPLALEILHRTTRMTLRPYPQSAILLFVRLHHSQNEARRHTTHSKALLVDALLYEIRQLHRPHAV